MQTEHYTWKFMHAHYNINFRCSLWLFRHALVSINWHRPWYLLAMHIPFEDIRVSLSRCHDTCMLSQIIPIWYMTTRRNGGCWCQAEKACWSWRCHGWTRGHSCRSAEWKNNAFGFTLLSFVFRIYVCISTYLKLVRWTFQSRFGTCFAPHFCQTFSMLLLD